ncbi:MAG TPA: secondary thiamine-phosphate synthase enzyme YjbQ [Baekduia sp.]|nr:secondary thiamine-phosphate synthase enzyme YjbQ [Baekduia sp.]
MTVHTGLLSFSTRGDADVVDLTSDVQGVVDESRVRDGLVTVAAVGSTAGVTTMEFEPGGVHDLQALLDRLVAPGADYEHNRRNHDTNGHAHLRASLIGPSVAIPVADGRLTLGTWQQIVFLDFDDRPRSRTVVVQVVG